MKFTPIEQNIVFDKDCINFTLKFVKILLEPIILV